MLPSIACLSSGMSAQSFSAWNARGACFLLDGPSGEAGAETADSENASI
ncbi:MAG TPA: hypothetical protein VII61_20725 [Ktedonobacteraceae bacterium]